MTGTISASESFCSQLTLSVAIMQVPASVAIMQFWKFYCKCGGGTFCYIYFGGSFCGNYTLTIFVEVMQLEVSAPFTQVKVSTANMLVIGFIKIMHVEVSVTIMQVVFSTVHYAHDYFYCNYAGDWL